MTLVLLTTLAACVVFLSLSAVCAAPLPSLEEDDTELPLPEEVVVPLLRTVVMVVFFLSVWPLPEVVEEPRRTVVVLELPLCVAVVLLPSDLLTVVVVFFLSVWLLPVFFVRSEERLTCDEELPEEDLVVVVVVFLVVWVVVVVFFLSSLSLRVWDIAGAEQIIAARSPARIPACFIPIKF